MVDARVARQLVPRLRRAVLDVRQMQLGVCDWLEAVFPIEDALASDRSAIFFAEASIKRPTCPRPRDGAAHQPPQLRPHLVLAIDSAVLLDAQKSEVVLGVEGREGA